ncbi:ATP-binding protein, partial [Candidatus Latescibacterota bacterium]
FQGYGLASAAAWYPDDVSETIKCLSQDAPLIKKGYIQPSGGIGSILNNDQDALRKTEFELTEKGIECLGLEKKSFQLVRKNKGLKEPKISLNDLAFKKDIMDSLKMGLNHFSSQKTLMKSWGLGERITYGRGLTLLFYGPPGTGKTATAEALAHELGKSLLVADYSKLQNCYVGVTEKNVVRIFNTARQYDAVLFWDEADAMFYDRDIATHSWESREVNVILQELERFEGVCILATNRKKSMDKALERRISVKIEFDRPEKEIRASIWRKLLPDKLPISNDVNIIKLSRAELSGGEIKNVILNASRLAYSRSQKGPVTAEDFNKAINMEQSESWSRKHGQSIGFYDN